MPYCDGFQDGLPAPETVEQGFGNDHYLQMQSQAFDAELMKLGNHLGLDSSWREKIKESLADDVAAAAKRISSQKSNLTMLTYSPTLESELQTQLWRAASEGLDEKQLSALEEFKNLAQQLRELNDGIGVRGLMVCLDRNLCLSQKQLAKLKTLYQEVWDSSYNEQAGMAGQNGPIGGRAIFETVGQDRLKDLLSDQQFEAFLAMDRNTNLMMALQMSVGGPGASKPVTNEKVKAVCDKLMDLKFLEYENLVGMTNQQRRALDVVRKGAVAKVVKDWEVIARKFADDPNSMMIDRDLLETASKPVITQCMEQSVWNSALAKVFDERQLKTIKDREFERSEFSVMQRIDFTFTSISSSMGLGLNVEQHREIVALVKARLEPGRTGMTEVYYKIFELADEDYQSVFDEQQWDKFEPQLRSRRAGLKELELPQEAAEENNDG